MEIRAATIDDHSAYERLFPELGVDDPLPSRARFADELVGRMVVAVDGGVVVGYAISEVLSEVGYVRNIVSAPERRRSGIGRALMSSLHARFAAAGATTWCLNVKPDNAAAIGLYERCGMRPEYRSCALRLPRAIELPPPPPGVELVPVPPEADATVEPALRLLRGQLASARARPSRHVMQLVRGDELLGVAVFMASVPGAFPCRLTDPAHAAAMLGHLRALAPAEAAFVQIGVEDDDAFRAEVTKLGAYVQLEILHMRGPLADARL